ncbi:MerR family transcriptional regulator [bacterium]|nr:MAG: MerR family transcriptional regulator [bacterium]
MKKLYYSIGEVCELCGVEHHHIRYWETKIPALKPHKNKAGNRVFTEKEVQLVAQLKELVIDQGYSVDGAKKMLSTQKKEGKPVTDQVQLQTDLKEIKQFLIQIREAL